MTCDHGMPTPASCLDCMEETGLGPAPKDEPTTSRSFAARYASQCYGCNLPIRVGQQIVITNHGEAVHTNCALDDDMPGRR